MNPNAKNERSTAPASTWMPTGALEELTPELGGPHVTEPKKE